MKKQEILDEAKRVLRIEAEALQGAAQHINDSFADAVNFIFSALQDGGKIVLSGVGKSGNVAQKVAATLTSTGSMAVFLHPTEALHGDLGLLGKKDILLVFSHSGSSQELLEMLPSARTLCSGVVAILGNPNGAIAQHSDHVIASAVSMEACPHNLAPTASSTLAMALMHKAEAIALLAPDSKSDAVILALTDYKHSGVCIVDGKTKSGKPKLVGIITEGDIRRALKHKEKFFSLQAKDVMTKKPSSVAPDTKAYDALAFMEQRERQISFLPVLDDEGGCVGVLRVHDLILAGLN